MRGEVVVGVFCKFFSQENNVLILMKRMPGANSVMNKHTGKKSQVKNANCSTYAT